LSICSPRRAIYPILRETFALASVLYLVVGSFGYLRLGESTPVYTGCLDRVTVRSNFRSHSFDPCFFCGQENILLDAAYRPLMVSAGAAFCVAVCTLIDFLGKGASFCVG
jgi:hypothetical protein